VPEDHTIRLARQARAEALLNDPMLGEAFTNLKQEYVTRWLATPFADASGREQLYRAAIVVEQVKKHLHLIAQDGKLAQADLAAIEGHRTIRQKMGLA
jgi:hypothetical protein